MNYTKSKFATWFWFEAFQLILLFSVSVPINLLILELNLIF